MFWEVIHIIPEECLYSSQLLVQFLKEHSIDCLKLVPSHMKVLLDEDFAFPDLYLIMGGERLDWDLVEKFQSNSPNSVIINHYGPTETTIGALTYTVEHNKMGASVPIGRPLSNVECYILDEYGQLAPVGVFGELYIAGNGLARGYLNNPALTNDKFVFVSLEHNCEKRMYKTGDLARYLPDGNIEFLRRIDQQVKIRGFRIELDEIAAALKSHGDVKDAIIVAKENQLIAYFVASEFIPTSLELRAYLEAFLPSYMIPVAYIVLEAFPLTSNGKLNQKALPIPSHEVAREKENYIAPTTTAEKLLTDIWMQLLGKKEIGIRDNFFHMGGDSIICIQCVSRARQKGLELEVKQIFQTPTIEALAKHAKIRFIENRLDESNEKLRVNEIESQEELYPLAPMQEGMLFRALYEPDSDAYIVQTLLEIEGDLNPEKMRCAWQQIIDEIPILRTGFSWEGLSQPLQKVSLFAQVPWKERDIQNQESLLNVILEADRKESFNLLNAPLMRLQLIQVEAKRYFLLWTKHHIILDGWSNPIILKRMLNNYENVLNTNQIVPYKKYIEWLQKQDQKSAEVFWKNYLSGTEEPTLFNTICEHSQSQGTSLDYEYLYLSTSEEETYQLKELAKRYNLTLNTIIQGLWSILLNCYLQKNDLIFGVTVSGRSIDLDGIEDMVGLFINTLPLRIQIDPEESFVSLIKKLQEDTLSLQEHAFMPLSKIQALAGLKKGHALFDHIFVFENFPISNNKKSSSSEISLKYKNGKERSEYGFTLSVAAREKLEFKFGYDTLYYPKNIIEDVANRLRTILKNVLYDENEVIKKISYLDRKEQELILLTWNKTHISEATKTTLHALFEEQVRKTPNHAAVVCDQKTLSYEELNASANQLAHYLCQLGVEVDQMIPICLDHSIEMMIGIFGVLKAGATYVPLDPSNPKSRLEQIAHDTNAQIILTKSSFVDHISFYQGNIICLDCNIDGKVTNLEPISTFKNLAYVIYTSGSTGKPKGVMIEHGSVVNYLQWCQKAYANDYGEGSALLSSFSFDMSITSLFLPLITGKTLFIEKEYTLPSLARLSWIKVTPTYLKAFAQQLDFEEEVNQPLIFIIGGEKLEIQDLIPWRQKYPQALFFNEYGPTEATVGCSFYQVSDQSSSCYIGKPITNTKIYILDAQLRPLPVGVKGELYIGGIGLSRGYLNQPKITSEEFIANPFSDDVEAKIYRTGDLARYLPCGNIEYLGRIDQQVKIKGYRIELKEIEIALKKHGDIADAIVIARDHKLIAYFIPKEFIPSDIELDSFLKSFLPEYLIPSKFASIKSFPMNANGKLEISALPELKNLEKTSIQEFVAPSSKVEHILAHIWSELLNVDNISIHDNFFHLGGDSIISIQAVSKARQQGLQINVRQIFLYPTIAQLTVWVQEYQEESKCIIKTNEEMDLSPIQKRFFELKLPKIHHFNQAMFLKPKELLDPLILEKALKAVINYHDAFHLRFVQERQIYVYKDEPVLHVSVNEIVQSITEQVQKSLDIENGPVIKAILFDNGEGTKREQKLLIVAHHLIIDGVSWRIFLNHLEIVYDQIINRELLSLPKKSTSWQDWIVALKKYASTINNEIKFWQVKSEKLPVDFVKGPNTHESADELFFSLNEEETTYLLQRVPKAYDTQMNDILLTALVLAVGDWSDKYSVGVSLEGHGREWIDDQIEVSQTIGWFTSIFPVFLTLEKPEDLESCLLEVKETLRSIPNRGIGYGILKYLSQADELKDVEEPGISFNYLGQWDNSLNSNALFSFSQELTGPTTALENPRQFGISINSQIREGLFKIYWKYSRNQYESRTMETLGCCYMRRLKQLIHMCSKKIENVVFSKKYSSCDTCLIPLQKNIDVHPFFCVHPIGGDLFWYAELVQELGRNQPFYVFENLSWAHATSPSQRTMQFMRDKYIFELRQVQPFGPYLLGGWSFGAYVAFEMAKQLEEENEIVRLIIFDQPVVKHSSAKAIYSESMIKQLQNKFINTLKIDLSFDENVYSDRSLFAYEYNTSILKNYKPEGRVNSVTIFNSGTLCQAHQEGGMQMDPTFGWKLHSNEQEIYTIPGDHYTIFQEPHVKLLAVKLRNSIQNQRRL